jgi:FHS family glucose/mannose:H+ symporter-like MFS transporter
MFAMMFFRQLYSFYIIYFISGYILGVIWIQANEFLLESRIENKNRLINIALVFFPVGAAVAPLLSIFVSGLGINWKYIFIIIAGFIIVTLVLYLSFKRGKLSKKIEVEEKIILKQIFFSKNNNFIFILIAVMLFFYGLTETIIFTFAPTFFRIEKLINPQIAGLSLSVFWIAISIGRIIISTLLCRLKVNLVALGLTLFSLAALLLIIYLNGTFAMLAAIFLTGLGYSGIFSLLFLNGSSIYEKGRAVLETILFVITSLGAALAPYLVKLATSIDLKIAIFLSLIFISLISIMLIIHIFYSKKYLDNKKTC